MATTPLQALPVPSLSDTPNGPAQFLAFGTAAEKLANMRFTTAAARDAAITSPEEGMEAYLTTPNQKTLYDGSAWISVPLGVKALTTTAVAQNGIGAGPTILNNLAPGFTAVAGHTYKISYALSVRQRTAPGVYTISAYETGVGSGTLLQTEIGRIGITDDYAIIHGFFVHSPAAGARTYRLQAGTTAGTLDIQVLAATPGLMMVEDLG